MNPSRRLFVVDTLEFLSCRHARGLFRTCYPPEDGCRLYCGGLTLYRILWRVSWTITPSGGHRILIYPSEGSSKNPLGDLPPSEPPELDLSSLQNLFEGRITLQRGQHPFRESKFRLQGAIFCGRFSGVAKWPRVKTRE